MDGGGRYLRTDHPQPVNTEKTISHHQKNKCKVGGDPTIAKQFVYSATCFFNSCAEQSHTDSVPEEQRLKNNSAARQSLQL